MDERVGNFSPTTGGATIKLGRLPRTAADDLRSALSDDVGGAIDLVPAFDGARSGHHDDFVAADRDIADLVKKLRDSLK